MEKEDVIEVKTIQKVKVERVQDLLCSALEGGSNYWYEITGFNYPAGQDKKSLNIEYPHLELPFKGGSLTIKDCEDDGKEKILDFLSIFRGLEVMARLYPAHFADFLEETDDADTGDVFLQCCLFEKVIYG